MFKFKVIGNNQHGFTTAKFCLTSLIFFYDETSSSVNEVTAENIIFFNFSKVLHGILKLNL